MGRILPLIGSFTLLLVLQESLGSVKKFSCVFDDDSLKKSQTFPPTPQFNEFNDENALSFKNEETFNKFIDNIMAIYPASNNGSIHTNYLTNYLRFYKTYRRVKDCPRYTDFKSFYQTYPVNFRSNYEPGGNIIRLMNDIVRLYPKVAKAGYFISRSHVEDLDILKTIDPTAKNLTQMFHHHQIAAIIKYKKYNPNMKNPHSFGYILLDLEIGASQPIFFDENEKFKIKDNAIEFKMGNTELEDSDDDEKEIEAEEKISNFFIARVQEESYSNSSFPDEALPPPTTYVYLFRQPYCSFVETTIKPNLLRLGHIRKKTRGSETVVKIATKVAREEEVPFLHEQLPADNFQLFYYKKLVLPFKFPLNEETLVNRLEERKLKLMAICEKLGVALSLKGTSEKLCLNYWQERIQLLQQIWADISFHTQCQLTLNELMGAHSGGALPGEKHRSLVSMASMVGRRFPKVTHDDNTDHHSPFALVDDNVIPSFGPQDKVGSNAKRGILATLIKYYKCSSSGF